MPERGIHVDHSTIHRKRPITRKWHVDETYCRFTFETVLPQSL